MRPVRDILLEDEELERAFRLQDDVRTDELVEPATAPVEEAKTVAEQTPGHIPETEEVTEALQQDQMAPTVEPQTVDPDIDEIELEDAPSIEPETELAEEQDQATPSIQEAESIDESVPAVSPPEELDLFDADETPLPDEVPGVVRDDDGGIPDADGRLIDPEANQAIPETFGDVPETTIGTDEEFDPAPDTGNTPLDELVDQEITPADESPLPDVVVTRNTDEQLIDPEANAVDAGTFDEVPESVDQDERFDPAPETATTPLDELIGRDIAPTESIDQMDPFEQVPETETAQLDELVDQEIITDDESIEQVDQSEESDDETFQSFPDANEEDTSELEQFVEPASELGQRDDRSDPSSGPSGFQGFRDLPTISESKLDDFEAAQGTIQAQAERRLELQMKANEDLAAQLAIELEPQFDEMREQQAQTTRDFVARQLVLNSIMRQV